MAAPCCPPTAWPALAQPADYSPKGTVVDLGTDGDGEPADAALKLYTVGSFGADSTGTRRTIVVLPEVFGWSGRLKGICDTLAENGYLVVMPDCHRGTVKPD